MSPSIRKLPDSRTSSEEAAASTRIWPCSIFHFMSWSKKASWLVCKVKASRFFLPGLQVDPGETRQLLDRAGHTGVHVGDVELGHLVSGDWTGVLHGEGNLHALSRRDFLPGISKSA